MYYQLSDYNYSFTPSLIAQSPVEPRDHARLMVVNREKQTITHHRFDELADLIPDMHLVMNDTKVIPARLYAERSTGARIEFLLHRCIEKNVWEVFARPAKKVKEGERLSIGKDFFAKVEKILPEGRRLISFSGLTMEEGLSLYGQMPLPPYIERKAEVEDIVDYQTVFANDPGSVAAPTAGLHFTEQLLKKFANRSCYVTLHVGAGTFLPVKVEDIRQHQMHTEQAIISPEAAEKMNCAKSVVAVGTTSCRTLESAADDQGVILPGVFSTDLFIYPGYSFKRVDALITNFHLPKTTLLMLVCTFGGHDLIMKAYEQAVEKKYRFFSYGDAMLVI